MTHLLKHIIKSLREVVAGRPRAATALLLMILVMAIQICAGIFIATSVSEFALTIVVLTAASATGWITGILASPGDGAEEKQFSKLSKAVSAFASGYLIAKTDDIINHIFSVPFLSDGLQASRAIGCFSDFLVTSVAAYAVRRYGLRRNPSDENTANEPETTHLQERPEEVSESDEAQQASV